MIRRVLMTADAAGGVGTYALELVEGLKQRGVKTTLAVMGPKPHFTAPPEIDCRYKPYKLEWMEDPWDDVDRAGQWLLELERESRPDVVHLNGFAHGSVAFRAPVTVVGHSCVLSWWRAVHGTAAPASWHEYRNRVTRGLQNADLVIAPSCTMRDALITHYGQIAIRVIPNGRGLKHFKPGLKESLIFVSGRLWDQAKNIELLDRIAPSLAWPVYVAGEGADFPNLKSLGVLGGEEMAHWFSRAAIYAHPARYEPFGLSVLEAAISGCALVLGDIPSLRENWKDAALFGSPDRAEQFSGQLNSLIESTDLRKRLQDAARERAQSFRATTMVDAYLEAYEWLLSHSAATFRSSTNPRYSRSRSASGARKTADG